MTDNVIPLYPASNRGGEPAKAGRRLHTGRRYPFRCQGNGVIPPPAGMVGNYQFDEKQALLAPVVHDNSATQAYVYDADTVQATRDWQYHGDGQAYYFASNHLILKFTEMNGPDLVEESGLTQLQMSPVFHLIYSTESHAAELGVIHLVQSHRFVTLANGERYSLLDAETPILYLPPEGVGAMETLAEQQQGTNREYRYSVDVQQVIPAQLGDVEVETVTVLEQYQTYFMQREMSDQEDEVIWAPALSPITWGWSIRVGRRSDQEWGILRRKLMLPTVGHDGLEFPLWDNNHLALSRPLPDER